MPRQARRPIPGKPPRPPLEDELQHGATRKQRQKRGNPYVMIERRHAILKWIASGLTQEMIRRKAEAELGLSANQTDLLYREQQKARRTDFEAERPYLKSEQMGRCRTWALKAAAQNKWAEAAAFERLIADIGGTREPVRVVIEEHTIVTQQMIQVIAHLTPDELDTIVAQQAEIEALAAQARMHNLPALPSPPAERLSVMTDNPKTKANGTNGHHR